jgi:hypothetical protein
MEAMGWTCGVKEGGGEGMLTAFQWINLKQRGNFFLIGSTAALRLIVHKGQLR